MDSFLEVIVSVPALAVMAAAFAQAVTGIGFALVCGPVLVAAFGPARGVTTTVLLAAIASAGPLLAERRRVEPRRVLVLLVPAALATPLVALLLRDLDGPTGMALAGVATLTGAGMLATGARWERARGRGAATTAGALSALMNYLGGVGGPAVALYATNAGWPVAATRAALQAYLLVLNLLTLAALGLPSVAPELLVALGAGTVGGIAVADRVPERSARSATLLLAAAGGVTAIVKAVA